MKTLRFLHTADLHLDGDPKKKAKADLSLNQILEYCQNIKVNAVIVAGDVFDKKQSYSRNSAVPIALNFFHKLSRLVDFIFITAGNQSHDETGSIELLHQIESNVYSYEYPVVLHVDSKYGVCDLLRTDYNKKSLQENLDYIVSLVPYPTKASLLIEDSIDNNNANFIEKFEHIFEHIGNVTLNYNCPKLLGFHGNVVGSRLSTGQTLVSQDIMVAPSTLERALHDYYALGHIHLLQEITPNMFYSGSIYNKNWGETEQKSFMVIEYEGIGTQHTKVDIRPILLESARPMITLDAVFENGDLMTEAGILFFYDVQNEEYRIRVKVLENERNLITDATIEKIKDHFGSDTKIEINVVPIERESRSEQIMHCKTLLDEVKEYATVVNESINGTVEKKVNELQEVGL